MEIRAAVFTSSPQDVEVYRDGSWRAGALLGWRHDAAGGCQVWVRLAVRGAEETSWLPLELLRLPEPDAPERHLSVVGAESSPEAAGDPALTGTMAALRAVPAPRSRPRSEPPGTSELTATMSLVAVRDVPEDDAVAPPRRPGGRRRAPEPPTVERSALAPQGEGPDVPGRHRAPATGAAAAGRHRAADTGVSPAVRDEEPVRLAELPRRRSSAVARDEPEAHLLTRPMRLGDTLDGGVPQPRRTTRNGRLSGV